MAKTGLTENMTGSTTGYIYVTDVNVGMQTFSVIYNVNDRSTGSCGDVLKSLILRNLRLDRIIHFKVGFFGERLVLYYFTKSFE